MKDEGGYPDGVLITPGHLARSLEAAALGKHPTELEADFCPLYALGCRWV